MPTVIIPSTLRSFSAGRDRVIVDGRTLRQVFDQLEAECPGIKGQLLEDGDIRPGLAIVVDNEITSEGLIATVEADTEVHILPAIGGGSDEQVLYIARSTKGRPALDDDQLAELMTTTCREMSDQGLRLVQAIPNVAGAGFKVEVAGLWLIFAKIT
jgi:molybdopterin converting factor small subunit